MANFEFPGEALFIISSTDEGHYEEGLIAIHVTNADNPELTASESTNSAFLDYDFIGIVNRLLRKIDTTLE